MNFHLNFFNMILIRSNTASNPSNSCASKGALQINYKSKRDKPFYRLALTTELESPASCRASVRLPAEACLSPPAHRPVASGLACALYVCARPAHLQVEVHDRAYTAGRV